MTVVQTVIFLLTPPPRNPPGDHRVQGVWGVSPPREGLDF